MAWVDLESDIGEMFSDLQEHDRRSTGYRYFRAPSYIAQAERESTALAVVARRAELGSWLDRLPPLPAWRRGRARSPWRLAS